MTESSTSRGPFPARSGFAATASAGTRALPLAPASAPSTLHGSRRQLKPPVLAMRKMSSRWRAHSPLGTCLRAWSGAASAPGRASVRGRARRRCCAGRCACGAQDTTRGQGRALRSTLAHAKRPAGLPRPVAPGPLRRLAQQARTSAPGRQTTTRSAAARARRSNQSGPARACTAAARAPRRRCRAAGALTWRGAPPRPPGPGHWWAAPKVAAAPSQRRPAARCYTPPAGCCAAPRASC